MPSESYNLYQSDFETASGMEPPTEDQDMQLEQMPHETDFVYPQGQFNIAPPQQVLNFNLDSFNFPADTDTEGLNLPVPHEGDNSATLLDSITGPPAPTSGGNYLTDSHSDLTIGRTFGLPGSRKPLPWVPSFGPTISSMGPAQTPNFHQPSTASGGYSAIGSEVQSMARGAPSSGSHYDPNPSMSQRHRQSPQFQYHSAIGSALSTNPSTSSIPKGEFSKFVTDTVAFTGSSTSTNTSRSKRAKKSHSQTGSLKQEHSVTSASSRTSSKASRIILAESDNGPISVTDSEVKHVVRRFVLEQVFPRFSDDQGLRSVLLPLLERDKKTLTDVKTMAAGIRFQDNQAIMANMLNNENFFLPFTGLLWDKLQNSDLRKWILSMHHMLFHPNNVQDDNLIVKYLRQPVIEHNLIHLFFTPRKGTKEITLADRFFQHLEGVPSSAFEYIIMQVHNCAESHENGVLGKCELSEITLAPMLGHVRSAINRIAHRQDFLERSKELMDLYRDNTAPGHIVRHTSVF